MMDLVYIESGGDNGQERRSTGAFQPGFESFVEAWRGFKGEANREKQKRVNNIVIKRFNIIVQRQKNGDCPPE